MSRSVPEWIGKNADARIPPRVKLRIFERYNGRCNNCHRIIVGRLRAIYDHVKALINGGANREYNIQLLCSECNPDKNRSDVMEKSYIYKKKIKRLGMKNKKLIPGSKGSGWKHKMDGTWEKR